MGIPNQYENIVIHCMCRRPSVCSHFLGRVRHLYEICIVLIFIKICLFTKNSFHRIDFMESFKHTHTHSNKTSLIIIFDRFIHQNVYPYLYVAR